MKRIFLILCGLALLGAGCSSADDGFVVNGSSTVIPGSMGSEIHASGNPLVPSLSVTDQSGL